MWGGRAMIQPAAMRLDDGPADCQAEARSLFLGSTEWLKDTLRNCGIDARAGVDHGDLDVAGV